MKKILSMILAFALCLSLVGCGSAAAASDGGTSNGGSSAAMIAETAAVQTEEDLIAAEAEAEEDVETTVTITLSDGASRADSSGVTISGNTVTITAGGNYRVTGTLTNGQIVVNAPEEKVVLALDGVSVTCENSAAIYVIDAKKVILSLVSGSENALASTGEYVQTDDNTVDAAIFSKDDLTIKGSGTLAVSSGTGHGIVSKDELKIKSGTITVTAEKKGMAANNLAEITGGSITIASGKHGIHCDEALTISHGTVNITKSFEGLEAKTMEISGGDISIAASDDGLNAVDSASGTEADGWGWGFGGTGEAQEGVYILISGGKLTVNASGDGIDSNGDLTITGGEVYVSGPTSDGDGALDYAGTGTITGGTIVAAGSSGMAQSLSSDTQGVVLLTLSGTQSAGSAVTLTDADGAVLASFTPEKAYSAVVISAPGMESSGTYTVACGSESRSVTLEGFTYSEGGFGGFGGGMPGGMGGGFDGDRPDGDFSGERPDGNFSGERPDGTPPSGFDGSKPNGEPPAGFSGGSGGQGQSA